MGKIAFVYPGQGAQKPGMGRDFYTQFSTAREVYEKATAWLGMNMKELCFEVNDRLDLTQYTQAAMVTTSMAMERVLEEQGIHPDITAGLSLGEYCAIATTGAMSLRDAIVMVRRRGIYMEEAVPAGQGGMAAVLGMDAEAVGQIVDPMERVSIANYNCPGQIVITGEKEELAKACDALRGAGAGRVIQLNVSGPFHSPMMRGAGERLACDLANVTWNRPEIPYVANVTAEPVTEADGIGDLLVRQISSPVRWQQSVERMIGEGVDTFVEIGPGRTLTGFLKKIDRNVTALNVETVEDMKEALAAYGR